VGGGGGSGAMPISGGVVGKYGDTRRDRAHSAAPRGLRPIPLTTGYRGCQRAEAAWTVRGRP
jgi:hypothetical protein